MSGPDPILDSWEATPLAKTAANDDPVLSQWNNDTQRALGTGLVHAEQFTPDEYATARKVAPAAAVPVDVAARNPDIANRRATTARLDDLATQDPRIASWLAADPAHVTLGQNSIEHLSLLDKVMGWGGDVLQASATAMANQAEAMVNDTPSDYNTPAVDRAGELFATRGAEIAANTQYKAADRVIGAVGENNLKNGIAQYQQVANTLRTQGHTTLADIAQRQADFWQGFLELRNVADGAEAEINARRQELAAGLTRTDPEYYTQMAATSAFDSVAALATGGAALEAGASTKAATWLASGTAGVSTYLQAYQQARDEGHDPDIADYTATAQGAIEILGEKFGLGKVFGEAGTVGRRALSTIGREAGSEAATQFGQTVSDALITGKPIDVGDLAGQTLDAAVVGGLLGGPEAVLGTHPPSVADRERARAELDRILRSANGHAQLSGLQGIVADMDMANHSPEATAAALQHLADNGGPTHVYVDAAQFRELYQTDQVNPATVATQLTGDPAAYPMALATGGDIAIPIAQYLQVVSRSKQGEAMAQHARLAADQLSPAELAKFEPQHFIDAVFGAGAADRAKASTEQQADESAIRDDVQGQLQAAGIEPGAASRYAALYGAVFRTLSQRSGQSAMSLWQRYGLTVKRTTAGTQLLSKNTGVDLVLDPYIDDVLQRGLENTAPPPKSQTLIDAVIQAGGITPDSVGAGDIRSQGGQNHIGLFNKAGMTAERMGEHLASTDSPWSHHFTTKDEYGRPDLNEFLAKLTDALQGTGPVLVDPALAEFADRRDQVQAVLRDYSIAHGVDPQLLSRPELRRIVEAGLGSEFLQSTRDGSKVTPNVQAERQRFDAASLENLGAVGGRVPAAGWVAGTTVRDASGNPGVVHRGSRAGTTSVEAFGQAGTATGHPSAALGVWFSDASGDAARYGVVGDYHLDLRNPKIYDANEELPLLDTPEEALALRKTLEAQGHDGIVLDFSDVGGPKQYVAFRPEQVIPRPRELFQGASPTFKSALVATVEAALRDAALGGLPLFQGKGEVPRGSIQIGHDRTMRINLFEKANLSTFLHESGHFFLEVLGDLAESADAPAGIREDYQRVLTWFGVADRSQIGTEQHEQFARGFEAYLREGKAPSPELTSIFGRFRAWLTSVYRQLSQLNVHLTDEVRGVFDRLIATDEEIEAAQVRQGYAGLDGAALGLSPEQMATYGDMLSAATEAARADVLGKLLRAQQRESQAFWREEVAAAKVGILAELDAMPVYRALSILRRGVLPDGSASPVGDAKLDRDSLVAIYGKAFVQKRLVGLYRVTGGVDAEVLALQLGFANGNALVQALASAKPKAALAEAMARQQVGERHPDPMTDGSLGEEAMAAVHGRQRMAVLDFELKALAAKANQGTPKARILQAVAAFQIGNQVVSAIKANEYLIAERKAARTAAVALAGGKYAEAFVAKRAQALNAALYRAALEAKADAAKVQAYALKLSKPKARAAIGKAGGTWLEQIDAILGQYSFARLSNLEATRRAAVATALQAQVDAGTLSLPAHVLAAISGDIRTRWNALTVDQLRGVSDTLKQLAYQAREANKLRLGELAEDRAEVDAAVAGSILGANRTLPANTGDRTRGEKLREIWGQGRAIQGTASDLARELDGFVDGGPVWTHTVGIIRTAMNEHVTPAMNAAQQALADIYGRHYTKDEIRAFDQAQAFDGIVGLWSKQRRLSLALNWGNAGNREALLTQAKNRLSPEQVALLLNTLDARDWAFVQDIAAHIDSYWPAARDVAKRKNGLAPEKVVGEPFTITTVDGQTLTLPGWYYPLKYSDSVKSMRDEAEDYYNAIRTGRTGAAKVKAGSLIERVGSGGRSVRLDLGVMQTHIRDTIRIIHLSEPINYVHGVLQGSAFSAAADDTGLGEHVRALELWLKDVAAGEIAPRVFHERFARAVRQNFTASVLTYKVSSAALQVTGIAQTGVVLGWKNTFAGVAQYLRRPLAMTRYVHAASPYMTQRAVQLVEQVQQIHDAQAGRWKAGHAAMIRWGYFMMGRVQMTVDVATWLGAEQKGMALFDNDVVKARAYADDIVTRAQGSGEFWDKTPLQRGTLSEGVRQNEYIKAATMLGGYMLAKGNAAYELTRQTNFRSLSQALRWSGNMTSLFVIEGLIAAALRGALPDDKDDDGWFDDVALWSVKDAATSLFGTLPGLGSMSGNLRGYDSSGPIGGSLTLLYKLVEQIRQGDADKALRQQAVNLTGVATGIPAGQINKTLDAVSAERAGQDVSLYEYATGPRRRRR
jgi:hypothetical protein